MQSVQAFSKPQAENLRNFAINMPCFRHAFRSCETFGLKIFQTTCRQFRTQPVYVVKNINKAVGQRMRLLHGNSIQCAQFKGIFRQQDKGQSSKGGASLQLRAQSVGPGLEMRENRACRRGILQAERRYIHKRILPKPHARVAAKFV